MKNYNKENISKFLAFTVWPKADYININDLNSIKLGEQKNDINFYKKEILNIFNNEISSYNIDDWKNIWLLLSWGLDSTLLLELLQKKYPNSKIYTYTLSYESDSEHLEISRKISEKYWTIHKEVIYDLNNKLFETFDDIYSSWYELEWEDSLIMNHILAKEVKKDCEIVFSWFWLDYMFWWMDLFKNSFMEKNYSKWLIDKSFILQKLWLNKFYLKYVLDKIKTEKSDFFIKYWEYYGGVLTSNLEESVRKYFYTSMSDIRNDISELKKQIFFIISTSLANRYRPYNMPYEKQWVKHFNPFWSQETIKKIIGLNIKDEFLLNPYTLEKKFIIRDIFRDISGKDFIKELHTWTVLKYNKAIDKNNTEILSLIHENKDFLLQFLSEDYYGIIDNVIKDSIWYENSKQIIILMQLIFYKKYSSEEVSNEKQKNKLLVNL